MHPDPFIFEGFDSKPDAVNLATDEHRADALDAAFLAELSRIDACEELSHALVKGAAGLTFVVVLVGIAAAVVRWL